MSINILCNNILQEKEREKNALHFIIAGNLSIPVGQSNGSSNAKAEILLVKENFVLVALRGTLGKRQLVFLPSKLHINDLKPNLSYYVVGDVVKIEISRYLLSLSSKLKYKLLYIIYITNVIF